MDLNPLGKAAILLCIPSPLELGTVLAFAIQFEVVDVLEPGEFGGVDRLFRQDCGNEQNSVSFSENKVSRPLHVPSNANWRIDRGQLHLSPCRGIVAAIEPV